MRKVSLGLVLAVCLSSFGELTYSAELPASEGLALGAIAAKLKISPDLWNFGLEPCYGWPKVVGNKTVDVTNELNCTCNETTKACHVQSIRLKSTNLVGELPDEELANLTHLATLDLTRNYIDGSIPTTWAKLPLKQISIIGNRLSGEIPEEIGDISTLESLLLSANNFVGELPDSLGKLTNLTDFRIDGTGISGKFPSFIGNWTLLKRLLMLINYHVNLVLLVSQSITKHREVGQYCHFSGICREHL